ncbi:MAG TPA: hypothetical protein VHA80_06980 [Solirubrobacterales bacterium]|nr:hypothetical protein [Solirubrobacterales bacterium]
MTGATGISAAVAGATVPRPIRAEGPGAVRGYRAALAFESMLLKEVLAEALPESPAGSGGEGEGLGGGEEGGGAFAAVPSAVSLPETVAEALVGAGGLGLASDLYSSFEGAGK